jgi:hypothetical protein
MKKNELGMRSVVLTVSLAVLLILSFEVTFVSAALNNQDATKNLPDRLIRVAEWMSKGNATYYYQLLNEMVQQEALKQGIIKSTNGAVLNPPLLESSFGGIQPNYVGYYWISNIAWISPPTIDIRYNWPVGSVTNDPYNTLRTADGTFGRLYTCGWNNNQSHPVSGEALANGPLTGTCQSGSVYVQGKRGIRYVPGIQYDDDGAYRWDNYVYVWVSDGYVPNPHYVGSAQITATSNTAVYAGPAGAYGYFNYIYFGCATPAWYPTPYSPHSYADVYCDTAFVYGSNP